MLMWELWPEDFPRLAIHCLVHDVPEAWVGDIPAPLCRYEPSVRAATTEIENRIFDSLGLPSEHDLDEEDLAKLKACDRIELLIWAKEQSLMGNQYARELERELARYFEEVQLPDGARELVERLVHADALLPVQSGVIHELASKKP